MPSNGTNLHKSSHSRSLFHLGECKIRAGKTFPPLVARVKVETWSVHSPAAECGSYTKWNLLATAQALTIYLLMRAAVGPTDDLHFGLELVYSLQV